MIYRKEEERRRRRVLQTEDGDDEGKDTHGSNEHIYSPGNVINPSPMALKLCDKRQLEIADECEALTVIPDAYQQRALVPR
jgi:hypothetical protein